jgi:hypothetical protein
LGAQTQRERDYIAAMEAYYQNWEQRDHRTRVLAYEEAMEQVYLRYPDDREAAIVYALALNEAVTVLPADKTFAKPNNVNHGDRRTDKSDREIGLK